MNTIVGFLIILIVSSCTRIDDCFHGTGVEKTEYRSVVPFSGIILSDNINLRFRQDSVYSLSVTAGEHLLKGIETRFEENTLHLENNNRCNWVRRFDKQVTVYVCAPQLNSLFIESSTGSVVFEDTLKTKQFNLDSYSGMGVYEILLDVETTYLKMHTGPSDLKVSGYAGFLLNYNSGMGHNDCLSLHADSAVAINKGTNDLKVNAKNRLDIELEGSGNIYYSGNPTELNSRISGSGRLIKL